MELMADELDFWQKWVCLYPSEKFSCYFETTCRFDSYSNEETIVIMNLVRMTPLAVDNKLLHKKFCFRGQGQCEIVDLVHNFCLTSLYRELVE